MPALTRRRQRQRRRKHQQRRHTYKLQNCKYVWHRNGARKNVQLHCADDVNVQELIEFSNDHRTQQQQQRQIQIDAIIGISYIFFFVKK